MKSLPFASSLAGVVLAAATPLLAQPDAPVPPVAPVPAAQPASPAPPAVPAVPPTAADAPEPMLFTFQAAPSAERDRDERVRERTMVV